MNGYKKIFLSDKEVSKITGIDRQTLCNWRSKQLGPRYIKTVRLVRYDVNDVLGFMEARKIGTQDQPKEQGGSKTFKEDL